MNTPALEIARQIRDGSRTAVDVANETLADIKAKNESLNCFTEITAERALREAAAVDARRARGETLATLAGVPYAVKNLYDIEGVTTLAGAKVNAGNAPAARDCTVVARLQAAGAVLVGALNMDEHAYGFTTENTHYGATHNPHELSRIAGGSSGGSGAAVAGGLVPIALGSDTNGSIRVPSSLCGIYGLKPTFGRLSRSGTFPFVGSLDHLGPMADDVAGLAAAYDAMQGPDSTDQACAQRPAEPAAPSAQRGLRSGARVAVLGGYFQEWADEAAREAVRLAAQALGASTVVELPGAEQARAAAFIITGAEGGALHRHKLQSRYADYEPLSRDRLVAGSLIPASWVLQAQRIRQRFYLEAQRLLQDYDILIAAATPVRATPIGGESVTINGKTLPARASMGLLAQPISCIGLPVCAAPIWHDKGLDAHLPIGVQLIGAHWREDDCFGAARSLELAGVSGVRRV
jgi:aspartyl-tRNA(Asn)/glutamyl-tRNA(Gln) amidotransferase subunit A